MPGPARRQGGSALDQGAARSGDGASRGADSGVMPVPPRGRLTVGLFGFGEAPPETADPAPRGVFGKAARQGEPRALEQTGVGREPGVPAGEAGEEGIERGLARRQDVEFDRRTQRLGRDRGVPDDAVLEDHPDRLFAFELELLAVALPEPGGAGPPPATLRQDEDLADGDRPAVEMAARRDAFGDKLELAGRADAEG